MKIELLKLKQVKVNEDNPRTITDRKFKLLIESILVFPKMLFEIRPVVVDEKNTALGGNMRILALQEISKFDINEIDGMMRTNKEFLKKTNPERSKLLDFWGQWLQNPTVPTVKASKLSSEERNHFIIADNSSFGQWDYDELANGWDNAELQSWGVDVWLPYQTLAQPQAQPLEHTPVSIPNSDTFDSSRLPIELIGADLLPDALPKIEGSDEVALERIIIVYKKDKKQDLCKILGIEDINKVIYNLDELM